MMRAFKTFRTRALLQGVAGAALVVGAGCKDVLKVQDPQNFASNTLDNPALWPSIANGVEGDLQLTLSSYAIMTGMLSDELWDSSTWIDWHDVSVGGIRANWATAGAWSGTQDAILRARFSAQSAATRFASGMKDTANTSPLMVQVKTTEAWADLLLAQGFCESPPSSNVATVSDTAMFQQALTKLTAALALAQSAHFTKASDKALAVNWMNAGIARANLMLGKYQAAAAAAALVPAGFEKDAIYSANSTAQNNQLFFQGNSGSNRSYTIRGTWYAQIDTVGGYLYDWFSGSPTLDTRVPLTHDNNNAHGYNLGAGGTVRFFSNGKGNSASAPVAMAKYAEMLLIQAEAAWGQNDNATAVSFLNTNRALASLPAISIPAGTADPKTWVRDAILSERFATLYTEGHRMQDLYRFGLVTAKLGAGRAIKLPLSRTEITNNNKIGLGNGKCPSIS